MKTVLSILLVVLFGLPVFGEDLKVYAAAAFKSPFVEIATQYEAATGHKVTFIFDTAGATEQKFRDDPAAVLLVTTMTLINDSEKMGRLKDGVTYRLGDTVAGLALSIGELNGVRHLGWANRCRSVTPYVNGAPGARPSQGNDLGWAHGFKEGGFERGSKQWMRLGTPWRRRQVGRQNSVSWGCLLRRAGATGGGRDGRPRESRIFRATTGSSMAARMRIREPQRGSCVP